MSALQEQPVTETVQTVRRVVQPQYLNTEEAAAYLGIAAITLEKWRTLRIGPAYTSLPRCTRYAVKDLDDFMTRFRTEAADKPFNPDERRGRPRKDGSRPNAETGSARQRSAGLLRMEGR